MISASQRLPALAEVPSATEAGLNYDMSIWAGIFAPRGTSPAIIGTIAAALDKALSDSGVATRLIALGASLPSSAERSSAAFDHFVKAEISRWSPVLRAAAAGPN